MLDFGRMEVQVQKLPLSEVKLTITLTDEELASYREKAAESLSKKVKVPGFRDGKAPAFAVEAEAGKEAFFNEVLRFALSHSVSLAAKQEKIEFISRPRVQILSKSPLKFEALGALFPPIALKNYQKVKIPASGTHEVSPKELDSVIRDMQKYHGTYEARATGVEKGDRVEIDFQGYDSGGAALENTKSKQHPLFVGEGTLIPAFEEQLLGMKTAEKKRFSVTFPKDFHHAPFRGKEVHFDVEMKKAEKVILPDVDEAFIEKITGQKIPVEAFREQVERDLQAEKRQDLRKQLESRLIEEWLKMASFDVSPSLIEEEIDFMIEDLAEEMQSRGVPWKTFLEYLEKQKKNLREEKRKEAEKRVRIRLLLNEIMRLENIQVTQEEFSKTLEAVVKAYPESEREKVRAVYEKDSSRRFQLINSLRLKKLFDKFLEVVQ